MRGVVLQGRKIMLFRLYRMSFLICFGVQLFCGSRLEAATAPNRTPRAIGLGVQPLGYPAAMIGAVIGRDAILKRALARHGCSLASLPFRKGTEMVELVGNRLAAAFLGDMPTIRLAARTDICVVGLVKQTFSSIVSRKVVLLEQLKGKRVGYAEGSSAHHTLLQALASVGLAERDVTLVPLEIDAMLDALETGRIDAFAAWEPATSLALARNPENRVLFKGISSDYFVLSRDFVARHPEAALEVVAGFDRAIVWMRKKTAHAELAALWAKKDGEALSGTASKLAVTQAVEIAHREILDVPSAPAILRRPGEKQHLRDEFVFLSSLGKIPKNTNPQKLQSAFDYDGLQQVLKSPKRYRLHQFNYQP
jgi:NitT/TauT family transport system substrate-binding protein